MGLQNENFSKVPVMWSPNERSGKQMRKFMKFIEDKYNVKFGRYWDFHQWTVDHIPEFWSEMWDLAGIICSKNYQKVIDLSIPISECPKWFEGAELNYAENLLKYRDDKIALIVAGEDVETTKVTYANLYEEGKLYAAAFRKFGLQKGDIVMSYMSNRKEAVFGMLAANSVGVVWAGAVPHMGPEAVLARFSQLSPKVLLCVDRYSWNGVEIDMMPKVEEISKGLPSLEKVIIVPSKKESKQKNISKIRNSCFLDEFIALGREKDGSIPPIKFVQVSPSHPVFISFTSGTTGMPKAIVHGSGILLSLARDYTLHMDARRGDIFLFAFPVGLISWPISITTFFCGLTLIVYEGNPLFLHPTSIWDLVDEFRITHLFISPRDLYELEKKTYVPTNTHDLKSLKCLMARNNILNLKLYDFVYNDLKLDILFASGYGITEFMGLCSLLDFTLPVHKGEFPTPPLATSIECCDETTGNPIQGERGELVISTPIPNMLMFIWGDEDGSKLREKYFMKYPGKFYLGDNGIVNPVTKGLKVLGRS